MRYTTNNVAIIVPTKDRPDQLYNLLNSLILQEVSYGRVIIVDGGQSIEGIVLSLKIVYQLNIISVHHLDRFVKKIWGYLS